MARFEMPDWFAASARALLSGIRRALLRLPAQAVLLGGNLSRYQRLTRLDRPIGIWLLLWPTLWALWIAADGRPAESVFVVFVLGTIVVRSAGCIVNDLADRVEGSAEPAS